MKMNAKTQRQLKVQHGIFIVLIIGIAILLAQLAIKTNTQLDWTANQRHSLSATTKQFLSELSQPTTIQVFISPNHEYRSALTSLLDRYQILSGQLSIHYIDPDFSPELVRMHNIQQQGEMVITQGEQRKHTFDLSEQSLTNALMAVSRQQDKWLVFIEGHGERRPDHQANFNLSLWNDNLGQKGFKSKTLNLVEHPHIPNNTAVVVIASPEKPWLPGEIDIIKNYINDGGNLLWLTEPKDQPLLAELAEHLGIEQVPGTIIDPNTAFLGIADPQFTLVTDYAQHPITQAVTSVTLFPKATALAPLNNNSAWLYQPLLTTPDNTWTDINPNAKAAYNEQQDQLGPHSIGYLLTSSESDEQQRIAVIGDGDFLSNSYLGNASNAELGLALMDWLAGDEQLIAIPVKLTKDNQLELSNVASLFIGLGFFVVLPAILLLTGLALWWYRRQQ